MVFAMKPKSVILKIRITEAMNTWIEDLVKKMQKQGYDVNKSSFCRTILEYYYGSVLLDLWGRPALEVKTKFHEFLGKSFINNRNQKHSNSNKKH